MVKLAENFKLRLNYIFAPWTHARSWYNLFYTLHHDHGHPCHLSLWCWNNVVRNICAIYVYILLVKSIFQADFVVPINIVYMMTISPTQCYNLPITSILSIIHIIQMIYWMYSETPYAIILRNPIILILYVE